MIALVRPDNASKNQRKGLLAARRVEQHVSMGG